MTYSNSRTCCLPLLFILLLISGTKTLAAIQEHLAIAAWQGTATCLQCHLTEGHEVFGSVHYQWLGATPYMANGPDIQGKLNVGVNSYCINITGNWEGCSTCHVGLGALPDPIMSKAQLQNIDCLTCHQDAYSRTRDGSSFIPDPAMNISMLEAARTVHLPTRITCLKCHAKGGGGDNFKRGDLALAHGTTSDWNFDVHMATSGADLECVACHTTQNHRMAGRGSDLRPTDLNVQMNCSDCHRGKASNGGHDNSAIDSHVSRIACQVCHIPSYARNAADTIANEETETHRDWRIPHITPSGAIHPTPTMEGDLIPRYGWWNGRSTSYLLYDNAVVDQRTGRIPTSRPVGTVSDPQAKLYPFKYKTATQPLATTANQLIALDTSVYFSTGIVEDAIQSGLANMGYNLNEPYSWVETDTLQLITHEVSPASQALTCDSCHTDTQRMNLMELGYHLKDQRNTVCTQCHGREDEGGDGPEYRWIHEQHVREEGYDCGWCHDFSRPERGLKPSPVRVSKNTPGRTQVMIIGILNLLLKP